VTLGKVVDAKKIRYDAKAVGAILEGVDTIHAMKGKQVVHLELTKKRKVPKSQILAAILGPFGTLRAPAFRRGSTLIVGFDEATYKEILR
jgi:arsenate reductase-like glutaredoxin family protein